MTSDTAVQANEMIWRFAHEDEQDNRVVISRTRNFSKVAEIGAKILIEEVIEDWADAERGSWEPDDMLHVIVIAPANMAGKYKLTVQLRASAVCYRETD